MLRSKWVLQIGFAAAMLVLAAVWTMHQRATRAHGAFYTHEELSLFVVSVVAGVLLAIQSWGLAAKKFIAGWISAAAIVTILLAAFDWFMFSATSNEPWTTQGPWLVMVSSLAVLTVYAPAFLALFAGVAWISHHFAIWHFGLFAVAGATAMIAPYAVQGIDIQSFAMAWWPFRAKDVALGAIAGVTFWYVAHPTKSAAPAAA